MERIAGPSMVHALGQAPWTVRRQAAVLAELHGALHDIGDPGFLPPAPIGTGTSVLHLDLHPLNVILGKKGPVVIDWGSAAVGDPDIDVGLAWVLMAAGEIPGGAVMASLLGWGRSLLVNGFMARFDRRRVAGMLRAIAEAKEKDPHMSEREAQAMWRVVARAERRL